MRSIAILLAGAAAIIAVGMAVSAAQPDPAKTLRSVQCVFARSPTRRSARWRCSGGRQGHHACTLHELPSGRRPPSAGRRPASASAAGRARRRQLRRHRHALHDVPRAGELRSRRHPGPSRSGTWRRSRWRGSASRSGEICAADQGSRSATAASRWTSSLHAYGRGFARRLGLAPGVGREPAPGTQQEFGELIKAWVDTGAVCPAS